MKLVINTQSKENYGAHDWDGKGECPQYWKFKGGNTYVVENLSQAAVLRIQSGGIPTLSKLLTHEDDYAIEYIIDWDIVDDHTTVCEPWETVIQLAYQQGEWRACEHTVNSAEYGYMRAEIAQVHRTWRLLPGGVTEDHSSKYWMVDGSVLSYSELEDWFAKESV